MTTDLYIEKFERIVDLLRYTGAYSSAVVTGTVYQFTSDVITNLAVKDYVKLDDTVKVRVTSIVSNKIFEAETFGEVIAANGIWKAMAPYSDYGSKKSINARLLEKGGYEFQYQKFPLIALRLPAPIDNVDGVSVMNANILIANFTNKQYIAQQRIANVFKPILYPLMTRFLDMVKRSGEFISYNSDYTQMDRLFYGTEAGDDQNIASVFDDPLDAVELRNLKLNFIKENC